ncbi:MAG: sugar phosphate nucleotidyltransferase, partial [Erysipelotrichaceae bacterium]|nr:sugar phosphate nucleotidyltransferase [Erysipelotrichaceae bacterium]
GDNIFYGHKFGTTLRRAAANTAEHKATVFGIHVNDPERFGVVEFDDNGTVLSLEEKPQNPKSHYAVPGLYFYDNRVIEYAKNLKPSARGEYEITDLNKIYLENGELNCELLGRGFTWLDTGTVDSLALATNYVKIIEDVQGIKISVPEEIAYYNHWIDEEMMLKAADSYGKSPYGNHLRKVVAGSVQTTYNKGGK